MGDFDWFKKIGATDQAVAVLNDQPYLFRTLLMVIVALLLQCGLIYYIHWATFKPSQASKPGKAKTGFLSKLSVIPRKNADNSRRRVGGS